MTRPLCITLLFCVVVGVCESASGQSYPIRRSTPYERGDRWRSDITSIATSTGKIMVGGDENRIDEKGTTRLSAVIEIDQVDEAGYATVWLARIVRFVGPIGNSASATLLRPGTVVLFDRIEDELSVTDEDGAPLDEAASGIRDLLMLPERADDAPFEPQAHIKVGDEWVANIESMRATILANGPPQLRQYPEVLSIQASGKLLAAKEYRDTNCLDVGFTTRTGITEELEDDNQFIKKADQQVEERFLIPADYAQDFLDKRTITTEVLLTESKGAGPSLDVTQVITTDEKRTYLEFQRGGLRPWQPPVLSGSLLDDLLFGLDFDSDSTSGSGTDARIQSQGLIAQPLRVKSSGHVQGKVDGAMRFDGQDDHVNVEGAPEQLRSGTHAVTVACWVKAPPKTIQFIFDVGFYADNSLTLVVTDKQAKFHVTPKAGGVGLNFPLDAADWTHVAVTWDGAVQRAYVNGKLVAEGQTTESGRLDEKTIGVNPFLIGSQSKPQSRGQRFFAGQMDEFALWTRTLDAAEIATVFAKGEQGQSLFDE